MNPLPRYNEKGELDTRLRVDPVTGDVGIGTPKRTWVGLTEEDLKPICDEWRIVYGAWMDDFARDIEAKLKEKNT